MSIQDDFQGLSPEQMHNLLYSSFENTGAIVQQNPDMGVDDLKDVPIVKATMFFLEKLGEFEPLKATGKGNLPLKFSRMVHDECFTGTELLFRINSEEDSYKLNALRYILSSCGWIKVRKKEFSLTSKGKKIVKKGFTGDNYFHLIKNFTLKFNWGFMDRFENIQIVQQSFLFLLYVLHKKKDRVVNISELGNDFIKAFPVSVSQAKEVFFSNPRETIRLVVKVRFIERFCEYFGFVNIKDDETVKVTDLFRKFFVWKV